MEPEGLQDMICESLRGLRFNSGRDYYFVAGMDGTSLVVADQPSLEGANILTAVCAVAIFVG